jgi:glycosyltransferase involved in cell wall biosynthesis
MNPERIITLKEAESHPSLLIFSDDWGRHPSSCQHLARILKESHRIWWVNTIGTRRPRLDLATLRRALEKARQWSDPPISDELPANPIVLNPRMWPYFRSSFDRKLNRELLRRQLLPVVEASRSPVIAITTIPIVADLVGVLPVDRWIYYCLDDYEEWPGLDKVALRSMESQLLGRVDSVIAVSDHLREKFAGMGRQADVLTHGTDLAHWAESDLTTSATPLAHLPGPLIVFWGVVDRRMDVAMLERLGADLDRGTIVLVGPEADPDPALDRVPRLVRVGPIPYDDLPAVARAARVLIMPYADLPVTRAMQPLKLKEYLATGKPVVVRNLPSTRCWSDALDLVNSPGEFSEAVRRRLGEGLDPSQVAARRRLVYESWEAKAAEFELLALGSFYSGLV